jgi:hypothetical protein
VTPTRASDALAALPATFRYTEARDTVGDRQLRALLDQQLITRLGRGLYRKADVDGDEDLIAIAARSPQATLCLRSALARHELIDDIPDRYDIALPRNTWPPTTDTPVAWHQFDTRTFAVGRDLMPLDAETAIGIYSAPRSIIDAFRLRHLEGPEIANEALRRWLRAGGQPTALLEMVRDFPRAAPALRLSLQILL